MRQAGQSYEKTLTEFVGFDSCHGKINSPPPVVNEVVLRVGVRDRTARASTASVRSWRRWSPPGRRVVTGFAGGRPKAREVLGFWPALVPKRLVRPAVTVETVP